MIQIKKLIWDLWNIKHIARHNVTTEEVEAVCHGSALILRGQQKGRLLLTGPTEENRMVSVVLESQGHEIYYPVTAYDADSRDITLYNRLKEVKIMKQTKSKNPSRIPEFKSYDEEAKFWETHSFSEFQDELKPVKVRFAKNLSEGITIRFDNQTLNKIRELAHKKGIGPTTLARMWIMEHLNQQI